MKGLFLKQTSYKPCSYDVFSDGEYKGMLFYAWVEDPNGVGITKGWIFTDVNKNCIFKYKKEAIKYLKSRF